MDIPVEVNVSDVVALDEALTKLREWDPRKAEVVQLRFFAGLTIEETAKMLGVSEPTIERDWRFARSLLYEQLKSPPTRD